MNTLVLVAKSKKALCVGSHSMQCMSHVTQASIRLTCSVHTHARRGFRCSGFRGWTGQISASKLLPVWDTGSGQRVVRKGQRRRVGEHDTLNAWKWADLAALEVKILVLG